MRRASMLCSQAIDGPDPVRSRRFKRKFLR